MTVVTKAVEDVAGNPDFTVWRFGSDLSLASDDVTIKSSRVVSVIPDSVDGKAVVWVDLDPGTVGVEYRGITTIIEVPDSDEPQDLLELLDAGSFLAGGEGFTPSAAYRGSPVDDVTDDGEGGAEFWVLGESVGSVPMPGAAWSNLVGKPETVFVSEYVAAAANIQTGISAAVTAAGEGGFVDFEGVQYVTTGTVNVASAGVTLGNGGIVPTGEFAALSVPADDVTVQNMTFSRAATLPYGQDGGYSACVWVSGERFKSFDCDYLEAATVSVYLYGGLCDGAVIRGGSMTGTGTYINGSGVLVEWTAASNQNITIEGVHIHGLTNGIMAFDTGSSRIEGNYVENLRVPPTVTLTGWTLVSGTTWKQRTAVGTDPGVDGPLGDRADGPTVVLFNNDTQVSNVSSSTPGTNEWGSVGGYVYANLGGTDPNTRTMLSDIVGGYAYMLYNSQTDAANMSFNRVLNNYADDCDGFGVYLQVGNNGGAIDNHICGNVLKNVDLRGYQTESLPFGGIGITSGAGTLIANNTIDGVGSVDRPAPGVNIFRQPTELDPSGRIVGTSVRNSWGQGYHIWSSDWSLTGCRAEDGAKSGFALSHTGTDAYITGVTMTGCVADGNAEDGFLISGTTATINHISANIVGGAAISNGRRGISVAASTNPTPTVRDVTVQGVTLTGNGDASYAQINLSGIQARTIVTGCTMTSSTANAEGIIVGPDCTDVIVDNNTYDIANPETLSAPVGGGAGLTQKWRGSGTPEGVITAPIGSIFQRSDSAAESGLYVKESGTGSAGWLGSGGFACKTATGSTGAENGADTWAKVATLVSGAAYTDVNLMLSCTSSTYLGLPDSVILSAYLRGTSATNNPTLRVSILTQNTPTNQIGVGSFKLIAPVADGSAVSTAELWVQKKATYGTLSFSELSRSLYNTSCTVVYEDNPAWQSATPTDTVTASSGDAPFYEPANMPAPDPPT